MARMRWTMAAAVLVACPVATAAQAQTAIEGRVGRLESEMRAVQRKVFPGGANAQPVEPQFTDSRPTAPTPGLPSDSPITDLTARQTATESQISTMTRQIEELQFQLRQEREAGAAYRQATDARLKALEDAARPPEAVAAPVVAVPAPVPATAPVRTVTPPVAKPATPPAAVPTVVTPAVRPAAGQAAVEKPATDDPADDGYVYGYRLWQAKQYREAIAALKDVTAKYPQHRRWSYAQNLLGRAYLDSGDASRAGIAFYDNYKTKPDGERAPDSLYYLAQSLTLLKKPSADICRVYAELSEVFGARLSAEMKTGVAEGRTKQKCP